LHSLLRKGADGKPEDRQVNRDFRADKIYMKAGIPPRGGNSFASNPRFAIQEGV